MAYLTYRVEITRDELSPSGTASVEVTAYIDCVPETNEHTEFTEEHLGLVLDLPVFASMESQAARSVPRPLHRGRRQR